MQFRILDVDPCVQSHQTVTVSTVKGTAIAARSHALAETCIMPCSFVCTNWVEKKFC
jgi:hypothetical protein